MFCVICMVNLRGSHVKTPCKHYFHVHCLKRLVIPHCPMCRKNITNFLMKLGLSQREIEKRIKQDRARIENEMEVE